MTEKQVPALPLGTYSNNQSYSCWSPGPGTPQDTGGARDPGIRQVLPGAPRGWALSAPGTICAARELVTSVCGLRGL